MNSMDSEGQFLDRIRPKTSLCTVQPLADGKVGGGLTGYTQLPYARRGRLRLRENRERGLRNGLNDKTKEGSTPIAVQKNYADLHLWNFMPVQKKLC